jgi:hypothetical protein
MGLNANGHYEAEDIAFYNIAEVTESGRYFKKNGIYTKAPEGSREFKEFWDREEDRRRNGMTIPGKLIYKNGIPEMQKIHITGEHYGFLNYAPIKRVKEEDLVAIRQFISKDTHLSNNARKVGKKDFDFPSFIDGQFHWFTAKKFAREIGFHVAMCKARRKGFSYMEGWDGADTVNMNPRSTVLIGAFDFKYITLGNQMMGMAKRYLDFLELHTDFGRGFIREGLEHIKLGYKLSDEGQKEFGYLSELIALSFLNNPDAAAGKDADKIKFEECGKFPNLKESLSITLSTTEDGSIKTGFITLFGTGGTKDANWADFEEIYYDPESYGCMMFDNVWDDGAKGTPCGFFYPQEVGDPAFVDENGNSNKEQALAAFEVEKAIQKKKKSNAEYLRWVGQRARNGKEAFANSSDNIFPAIEILDQLQRVEHDPDVKYLHRCGVMSTTEHGVKFKLNSELEHFKQKVHDPIFNFPLKDKQDVDGCYVEWISPYRDPLTGKIPKGLYRLWHDPYAHDTDKKELTIKHSLGTTYVYERMNNFTPGRGDYFIGAYVGRPERMDDYNEQLLKIAQYVNGEIMFENDRGDVKGYATRKKLLHLLADEPDLEWVAELKGKSRRDKGMNMTEKRKEKAAIFLRDWLLEVRGRDANGNAKLNLHYIYDPALLRELLKWNLKGNFDRVSALLVGMFDMKECFNKEIKVPKAEDKLDFFNRDLFSDEQNYNDPF